MSEKNDTSTTNERDIDALLLYLKTGRTPNWYESSTRWQAALDAESSTRWHTALAALLAERNELKAGVGRLWQILESAADRSPIDQTIADALTALVAERNALQRRVAELEAPSKPADRDLRERNDAMARWMDQVTVMLYHSMTNSHDAKQELMTRLDAAIASMRKETKNA